MSEAITSIRLRIDWSEIDSFGHINNLAILRYAQTARLSYLEQLGMMDCHAETGIGPVLASTTCQFRKQLFYPGHVTVRSLVEHVKTTSFHMLHVVLNDQQECVAEMRDVLVMFDYGKKVKHPISDAFREKLGRVPTGVAD
jgi:acyl-CoA thioester hydrolase